MVRIFAFLTALTLSGPLTAAGLPNLSQNEVEAVCFAHYQRLLADVVGALNMGMSPQDVLAELSKKGDQKQLFILYKVVAAVVAHDDEAAKREFDALIAQCVQDNYNPKQKM